MAQDFAIIGDVPEAYRKESRTWLIWGLISTVPLTAGLFDDQPSFEAALKLLGAKVCYLKKVEHQGVPTLGTDDAVQKVIQQFIDHQLSYFGSQAFPRRFVQSELNRVRSRAASYVPLRAHV